ncbi:MAG: cytochrome c maturation protein CcmE [Rhizobiales bacterium]|nr:cytochrome c maturation protein CcmE [Hyphomicrobiales bacterium]
MTRKQRRATFIITGLAILALAVGLVLNAMRDNIVFFYSPSDIVEKGLEPGRQIRLGGLVEQGSVEHAGPATVTFTVTDLQNSLQVSYTGILPDLFREGQGVVAEGKLQEDGSFIASNVLAKHDEKYMPPEVAEALKKSGNWTGEGAEKKHSETYGQGSYP